MMGRPPRALKDARALRTTGALVFVAGAFSMLAPKGLSSSSHSYKSGFIMP